MKYPVIGDETLIQINTLSTYWKLAGFIACCSYFFYCILHLSAWHFIDGVNLIIHEAGHVIFQPFGTLVTFMGGSLLQIMVPCMFAIYFWVQKQFISSSIMLLWVGQNFINISVYVGDAIAMQLPLLGDDASMHDWNNILRITHSLQNAPMISHMLYAIGFFVMMGGVGVGGWKIFKKIKR
ncbi:MAG: hypothetical protein WC477_03175 [Patescibacteria group bacterium]